MPAPRCPSCHALRGVHHQRARPQGDPGQAAGQHPGVTPGDREGAQGRVAGGHAVLGQRGRDRQLQRRLADVVARVRQQPGAKIVELGARGVRANDQAVAAGFGDRLHHQFGQVVQRVGQRVRFGADMGFDIGQDRVLAEIVADDARHVGIHRLVVGHPGADGVGDRHVAAAPRLDHPAHPQRAVRAEHVGIQEVVVQPAIDQVHRRQPGSGVHEHAVVLDHQVAAFHQRHAHLARQEDMLEIGGIEDAGR